MSDNRFEPFTERERHCMSLALLNQAIGAVKEFEESGELTDPAILEPLTAFLLETTDLVTEIGNAMTNPVLKDGMLDILAEARAQLDQVMSR